MKDQMKIKCKKKIFERMVTRAKPFIDELVINIDEKGMHARLVDAAHVAMYDCNIDKKAFEDFKILKELKVGINLKKIDMPLSLAGEDIELEYLEYEAKLKINNYKQALVDITNHNPIKKPELNLPIEIQTDKTEFIKKLASVASRMSKTLEFYVGEDLMMYIRASGELDEFAEPIGKVNQIRTAKFPIITKYSIDVLSNIFKDLKEELIISFNTNEPMSIIEKMENEEHTFMIAPRVESE